MEIENDEIAMAAIVYFKDQNYSIEQVLLAMAVKPKTEPEDLLPWPVGAVVREVKTGYRLILTEPLVPSDDFEFVCEKAHGEKPDPDYSYMCNNRYCRCSN